MSKFAAVLPFISGGFKIAAGVQQRGVFEDEAALQEEQGRIVRQEAQIEAARTAKERRKFLARQKLAFIKSGVSLEGSPLLVLAETKAESQKEVDAIVRRGQAQQRLFFQKAAISRSRGRAALLGGIGIAAPDIFSAVTNVGDIFKKPKGASQAKPEGVLG